MSFVMTSVRNGTYPSTIKLVAEDHTINAPWQKRERYEISSEASCANAKYIFVAHNTIALQCST